MKIWVNQVINKMISFFFFLVWRNLHLHCIRFVLFMNIVLCNCNHCTTHTHTTHNRKLAHLQLCIWWCCCFKSHFGLVYTLVSSLYFSLSSFMIVITTDNITNNNNKNNNFRPKFLGCLHWTFQCFQNIILF